MTRSGERRVTPGLVDQYFSDSAGERDDGNVDTRGVGNKGNRRKFVDAPAFRDTRRNGR